MDSKNTSPASTHCSELDYLIGLQSEDLFSSQLRRSQRLVEKEQIFKAASNGSQDRNTVVQNIYLQSENMEITANVEILGSASKSCSPQLFTETDEYCSQIVNLVSTEKSINHKRKTVDCKRAGEDVNKNNGTSKHRRRSKTKSPRRSLSTPKRNIRQKNAADESCSQFVNFKTTEISDENEPKTVVYKQSGEIENNNDGTKKRRSVSAQTKSSRRSQSTPNGKARLMQEYLEEQQLSTTTTHTKSHLITPPQTLVEPAFKLYRSKSCSEAAPQSSAPLESRRKSLLLTQTIEPPNDFHMPERYPEHFIHQLPISEPTRNASRNSFSPGLLSNTSSSPSLSESLADLFGVHTIRELFNIAPVRKYILTEEHLPALAFMLNIELGRLHSVLELIQRLSPMQLEQMAKNIREPSLDIINLLSPENND